LPWKKFLVKEREISFTTLVKRQAEPKGEQLSSSQVDLKFKVLTEAQDKFDLPKYHQDSSILNIDYDNYLVIYAGLDDYQRPGYEVRIENIVQQEQEINVRLGLYAPQREIALEIISFPYDLVKIDRKDLQLPQKINFKFTTKKQCELLAETELELE